MTSRLNRTLVGSIAGIAMGLALLYALALMSPYQNNYLAYEWVTQVFSGTRLWMAIALVIGVSGVLAALVVASAIADHTQALRDTAEYVAAEQAAQWVVTDENWQRAVEQILADLIGDPIYINAFSAMSSGPVAWIRFMGRDSRAWVFASSPRVPECKGRGTRIRFDISRRAAGELRALWNYFQAQSQQAAPLPRNTQWYLMPAQTPQDKTRRSMRIARVGGAPCSQWRRGLALSLIKRGGTT